MFATRGAAAGPRCRFTPVLGTEPNKLQLSSSCGHPDYVKKNAYGPERNHGTINRIVERKRNRTMRKLLDGRIERRTPFLRPNVKSKAMQLLKRRTNLAQKKRSPPTTHDYLPATEVSTSLIRLLFDGRIEK